MSKFRKKPVVIEAERWVKDCAWWEVESILYGVKPVRPELLNPPVTVETACKQCGELMWDHGWVHTLEGGMLVCPGDWIIRGVKGEKYPCKADVFEATYERVEHDAPLDVMEVELDLDDIDEIAEDEDEDGDGGGTRLVPIIDTEGDTRVLPTVEAIANLMASGLENPTEKTKAGKDMRYLQRLNNYCNDVCLLNPASKECKACPVMSERKRHMPDFEGA